MKQKLARLMCMLFGHKGWVGKLGRPIICKRCGALWGLSK